MYPMIVPSGMLHVAHSPYSFSSVYLIVTESCCGGAIYLLALSSQHHPQGEVIQLISAVAVGSQLSPPSCKSAISKGQSSPAVRMFL